jgi:hypothetical protein
MEITHETKRNIFYICKLLVNTPGMISYPQLTDQAYFSSSVKDICRALYRLRAFEIGDPGRARVEISDARHPHYAQYR